MNADTASGRGALIVIAAPSGAGKTTLVRGLLERMPQLKFSVSCTTREARPTETDGVDYRFVDEASFRRMVEAGEFLEHAEVFDHWYGTLRADIEALRAAGHPVLLEIDWQGAQQLRKAAPDARFIFIAPPDVAALEQRLKHRGTDSAAVIARRLADSLSDLKHWDEFDYVIVNDELPVAVAELADIVAGGGAASSSRAPAVRERMRRMLAGTA